jgi:hypothetical protein
MFSERSASGTRAALARSWPTVTPHSEPWDSKGTGEAEASALCATLSREEGSRGTTGSEGDVCSKLSDDMESRAEVTSAETWQATDLIPPML